jgi:hypothetical protein
MVRGRPFLKNHIRKVLGSVISVYLACLYSGIGTPQ